MSFQPWLKFMLSLNICTAIEESSRSMSLLLLKADLVVGCSQMVTSVLEDMGVLYM